MNYKICKKITEKNSNQQWCEYEHRPRGCNRLDTISFLIAELHQGCSSWCVTLCMCEVHTEIENEIKNKTLYNRTVIWKHIEIYTWNITDFDKITLKLQTLEIKLWY